MSIRVQGVLAVAVCAVLFGFILVLGRDLDLRTQAYLGWTLVVVFILVKSRFPSPQMQRIVLMLFSALLTLRYFTFRVGDTLIWYGLADSIAMVALFAAEAYSMLVHGMGMLVNVFPLQRKDKKVSAADPGLPGVDVFIPTYNEPEEIVGVTMRAATLIDYPRHKLNICLLDDGSTMQKRNAPDPVRAEAARQRYARLRQLAKELGVCYLTRDSNLDAKAGNITNALESTECGLDELLSATDTAARDSQKSCGEYILLLDADHVPARDILLRTVPWLTEDPSVYLVQTPHFFINPDPVERNLGTFTESPGENEMFYGAVHLGLDFWNASFFCGSAAVIRRRHLEEIGGLANETVTEDAETALALHSRGYKSVFVARPMICGLSPETFADFIVQRSRWATGMIQILRLKNPLTRKGLGGWQRLCYLNSCIFWFFGLARLGFILAPLTYLFFGLRVYNASLHQVLAFTAPYLLVNFLLADHLYGRVRHPLFSEVYETVQSISHIPVVLSAWFRPRDASFTVTPKHRRLTSDFLSPLARPFYPLLALVLAGFGMGAWRLVAFPLEYHAVVITFFWNILNLLLLLAALGVVWERRQIRATHRIPTRETVTVGLDGPECEAVLSDLSLEGAGLEVQDGFPAGEGGELVIRSRDNMGRNHVIRARIMRSWNNPENGRPVLGCRFVIEDDEEYLRIIDFVYGDSSRWLRFWTRRRGRRRVIPLALLRLMVVGAVGGWRNLRGVGHVAKERMKKQGTGLSWQEDTGS
jgi:cellulose synthase (UDP-forming)